MQRRQFLTTGAAAAASLSVPLRVAAEPRAPRPGREPFRLKYAPHLGMFKHLAGDDPFDQVRFMADQGFEAFECNEMTRFPKEKQERFGKLLDELGMTMGVFVCNFGTAFGKPSFTSGKPEYLESFLADLKNAVDVAKRCNAKWATVVLGDYQKDLEPDYQTANAIEMLKRGAEVFEPHGLVMVMEPLNPWANHPGMFLTKIPQAYALCKAVGSPAVKILNDLYHQQITEGNLIPNIDRAWDEIAYFQVGDNPGRKEPGTGEIHYRNVFGHIHEKGFTGVLGMEHGNSQSGAEGERAVIAAYRDADAF
ncbi:MAG: TIM barrel protein [Planctomycetota bacterium]